MKQSNFNLRGIPSEVMAELKQKARNQHISVNVLILNLLKEGIGFQEVKKRPIYHDLDKLAGTWSKEEAKEFEKNTAYFKKVDKELWQ